MGTFLYSDILTTSTFLNSIIPALSTFLHFYNGNLMLYVLHVSNVCSQITMKTPILVQSPKPSQYLNGNC